MQPRISLVTLGYTDFHRARRFYEALGWMGTTPDDDVFFMQAGSMILALWDRHASDAIQHNPAREPPRTIHARRS